MGTNRTTMSWSQDGDLLTPFLATRLIRRAIEEVNTEALSDLLAWRPGLGPEQGRRAQVVLESGAGWATAAVASRGLAEPAEVQRALLALTPEEFLNAVQAAPNAIGVTTRESFWSRVDPAVRVGLFSGVGYGNVPSKWVTWLKRRRTSRALLRSECWELALTCPEALAELVGRMPGDAELALWALLDCSNWRDLKKVADQIEDHVVGSALALTENSDPEWTETVQDALLRLGDLARNRNQPTAGTPLGEAFAAVHALLGANSAVGRFVPEELTAEEDPDVMLARGELPLLAVRSAHAGGVRSPWWDVVTTHLALTPAQAATLLVRPGPSQPQGLVAVVLAGRDQAWLRSCAEALWLMLSRHAVEFKHAKVLHEVLEALEDSSDLVASWAQDVSGFAVLVDGFDAYLPREAVLASPVEWSNRYDSVRRKHLAVIQEALGEDESAWEALDVLVDDFPGTLGDLITVVQGL